MGQSLAFEQVPALVAVGLWPVAHNVFLCLDNKNQES